MNTAILRTVFAHNKKGKLVQALWQGLGNLVLRSCSASFAINLLYIGFLMAARDFHANLGVQKTSSIIRSLCRQLHKPRQHYFSGTRHQISEPDTRFFMLRRAPVLPPTYLAMPPSRRNGIEPTLPMNIEMQEYSIQDGEDEEMGMRVPISGSVAPMAEKDREPRRDTEAGRRLTCYRQVIPRMCEHGTQCANTRRTTWIPSDRNHHNGIR